MDWGEFVDHRPDILVWLFGVRYFFRDCWLLWYRRVMALLGESILEEPPQTLKLIYKTNKNGPQGPFSFVYQLQGLFTYTVPRSAR
jgi:hypothetical protein